MKHLHLDVEAAGFYGAYWPCTGGSDCVVIAMIGDDPEDRLARSAAKWLCARGVNVLTMSPAKKDYGHHNYPLERVEAAINWLKNHGIRKIGIVGASTTGTLALTAATYFSDITLTIGMTPSDFICRDSCRARKMVAKNGLLRVNLSFPTKESLCLICHLFINTRSIGSALPPKPSVPAIWSTHGSFLTIPKRHILLQKLSSSR